MRLWSADVYARAWRFAATAHGEQKVPGTELPYIEHVAKVAMETMTAIAERGGHHDADLAVQCALLHDVVEDTPVTLADITAGFGAEVAAGVSALTKDPTRGDKPAQMRDCLARILLEPQAVWMVKLADRITNLEPPPHYWNDAKIAAYREEARDIHAALSAACPVLGPRLLAKIEAYPPAA